MTDQADQEILQLADDIRSRQAKDKEVIYEQEKEEWYKSMIGKYFIEKSFLGADDEAFRVFWVRCIDWHHLQADEIKFAHIGHFHMGECAIYYEDKWNFDDNFWKEIDEIEFLRYLDKFLRLTGWKQKMEKEVDH